MSRDLRRSSPGEPAARMGLGEHRRSNNALRISEATRSAKAKPPGEQIDKGAACDRYVSPPQVLVLEGQPSSRKAISCRRAEQGGRAPSIPGGRAKVGEQRAARPIRGSSRPARSRERFDRRTRPWRDAGRPRNRRHDGANRLPSSAPRALPATRRSPSRGDANACTFASRGNARRGRCCVRLHAEHGYAAHGLRGPKRPSGQRGSRR